MKVVLSKAVVAFVRTLAPEPRRRVREAFRSLEGGHGDIKALEPPLDAYCRLRVGGFRIILAYRPGGMVECLFAERRSVVYEVFEARLKERIQEP